MSLPERLATFRANFEAGGPPYNAPNWVHARSIAPPTKLIAAKAADKALKSARKAPAFVLKDADSHEVFSRDLLARGPLVVTFYRGVWCPYCNMDLQAMQEALASLQERGASLIAISPQTAPNSGRSQRENNMTFPILSDPRNATAAAFGLRFELPGYLKDLYKDVFKNDLEVVNGDASWTLPMPGTLRHRTRRRHRLCRGQSGLHAASPIPVTCCRFSTSSRPVPRLRTPMASRH